jgi:hypothetical protein
MSFDNRMKFQRLLKAEHLELRYGVYHFNFFHLRIFSTK